MGRATPIWQNFNSGELSPTLDSRTDNAKYMSGMSVCENFVPIIQGPLTRRPGSWFIEALKPGNISRNIRFSYSIDTNYVLEFGDGYIRFWRDRALLLDGGLPYEIVSPFTTADLFKLRYVQSADVIYFASGRIALQKLTRLADTNWTITDTPFRNGPLADQNTNKARTMWYVDAAPDAGAPGNVVTLKSNFNVFTAAWVGTLVELEIITRGDTPSWVANIGVGTGDPGYAVDDHTYWSGNFYIATQVDSGDGHSGPNPPVHTEGEGWDGQGTVKWLYLHSGYGLVQITGFTDPQTVTATVLTRLPLDILGPTRSTYRWTKSAYDAVSGWPVAVQFFRERLALAGRQRIDESVAQDFEDFKRRDAGEVSDDLGINVPIASGSVNNIEWLSPDTSGLIIGTRGQEFLQDEASSNNPFGSTNSRVRPMSQYGSASDIPVDVIGDTTVYIQRTAKRLMGAIYDFTVDKIVSTNLTKYAEHVIGPGIVDMAYQQNPYSIMWMLRADGDLIGMTFDREQGVVAFHRHPMANAFVDSMCVIPSPDGLTDDLWVSVRRNTDVGTVRYQEIITFQPPEVSKYEARYLDSSIWRNYPSKVTVVDGLDHLNGNDVDVLADGAVQSRQQVVGGQITLEYAAKDILIGLPMTSRMRTMRLDAGQNEGTAQGRKKRIFSLYIRMLNTLGGKAGPDLDELDIIPTRAGMSTDMDQSPPSVTGDIEISFPGGWNREGYVAIQQDQPLPMTIVSITPREITTD